jgi:hypothetical protein
LVVYDLIEAFLGACLAAIFMTLPAIRTAGDLTSSDEDRVLEDELNPGPPKAQFKIDQPVCVTAGPLVGLRGMTDDRAPDGRWVIRVIDAEPGVYLCIESRMLSYE